LHFNGEIEEAGKILDQYYIVTRDPDSIPSGAPFDSFTKSQAEQAIELASSILQRVKNEFV
jgi:HEPN domain-containing protein